MIEPQLPGSRWFRWLRNATLRIGLLTGIYLSIVLGGWLVVANRVPWSANFAGLRNRGAAGLTLLLMLIPVVRFLRQPARLFASGIVGWAILTWTYFVMGMFFERLFTRMRPGQLFMLGAVVYGFFGVVTWVVSLVLAARHHRLAPSRRRTY